ncbi:sensor histidine kinase [Methylovirgula ligni]|uniref:histidine kinase n=1 Tax=Methylovirgula ligni TaxID=569860 RepID=A0A3D9Z0U6_9HYPH|nr:HAMP domain-containing sensor histidine kinase [Methylovirgula ligni]QAY95808.1 sensor histidine kinase [Methylovirgula ligni]REF88804.1 signal transduction histidine kinase /histidine kinase [Methylovirgula ligni]
MRDFITIKQQSDPDDRQAEQQGLHGHRPRFGLATRVVLVVAAFIMATEFIIYVPIVVNYRDNWLRNRLAAAYTATLVLEAGPRAMVSPQLSRELLDSVGARIIVLQTHGTRRILAATSLPPAVDEFYDLRHPTFPQALASTWRTYFAKDDRVVTVLGAAPMGDEAIEVTMDEGPVKEALHIVAVRVLTISLTISALVAALAVGVLNFMVLRPMRRLTNNITEFGADPENASRIIVPSGHTDEIGRAEEALATMQDTLVRELTQKKHLAALGLAVAKINHDLRNMLASAQLLSDRLANVTDPLAQRLAPKLVATLDRAIRFCQATLTYGRATDEAPKPRLVDLRPVVAEAAEAVCLSGGRVMILNKVSDGFILWADPEHLFRVMMNLLRNGVEALDRAGPSGGQPAQIIVSASAWEEFAILEIADTGPGVPPSVRAQLFTPFSSSSRPGGSGLGLAIAADLVRAHGGSIELMPETDENIGARFRITLPQRRTGAA